MSWSDKLDALASFAKDKVLESSLWSLRWCKRMHSSDYGAMRPYQRVNHFPATWGIGRKDNLHKRLKKFADSFGDEQVYFFPAAFLLPQDGATLKRDMQQRRFPPAGQRNNIYIVKQVASACGRGMHLLKGKANPNRVRLPEGQWLVQRYIHDPFLIDGFKFDLRIYVLVTSFNPLRVYIYEDGLVRFATTPYPTNSNTASNGRSRSSGESDSGASEEDDSDAGGRGPPTKGTTKSSSSTSKKKKKPSDFKLRDISAHLTNYSVNKHTSNFVQPDAEGGAAGGGGGAAAGEDPEGDDDDDDDDTPDDEKGSKWVISTLKRYLEQKCNIPFAPIWRAVVDVILKTLISVEADVNSQMRLLFSGGGGTTTGGAGRAFSATSLGEDGKPLPHASLVHRPGTAINNCFELYGFDILLRDKPMAPIVAGEDNNNSPTNSSKGASPPSYDPQAIPRLTPVLMEVNIMPSLHTRASTLDQRVKANMMGNLLNIVGVYASKKRYKNGVPAPCPAPMSYAGPKPKLPVAVTIPEDEEESSLRKIPPLSMSALTAGLVPSQVVGKQRQRASTTSANTRAPNMWETQVSLLPFEGSPGGFPFTSTAQDQTGGGPATRAPRVTSVVAVEERPPTSVRASCTTASGRRLAPPPPPSGGASSSTRSTNSNSRPGAGGLLPPAQRGVPRAVSAAVGVTRGGAPPQVTPSSRGTQRPTPLQRNTGGSSGAPPTTKGGVSSDRPAATKTPPPASVAGTVYEFHPFFQSLTPVEMDVVCQAEEELDRRGSFTRIFPPMPVPPTSLLYDSAVATSSTKSANQQSAPPVLMSSLGWEGYKRFYVEPRPYNEVLHRWEYVKQVDPPAWYSDNQTGAVTKEESVVVDGADDDNSDEPSNEEDGEE